MRSFLKVLPGILLIAGIGFLLWLGVSGIAHWVGTLDQATRTALLSLAGLLLVPIVTYFTQRNLERRRSLDASVREHKVKLYEDMMQFFISVTGVANGSPPNEKVMAEFFAKIPTPLISYGSRSVIRAWNQLRAASAGPTGDDKSQAVIEAFEGMLQAMRKDLGHNVAAQPKGELLKVFVNDVDDFYARQKAAKKQR